MSQADNFDQEFKDANANPDNQGHVETTTEETVQDAAPEIDYKVKFGESSKEALRLLEEKKQLERANAELLARLEADPQGEQDQAMEGLYPGFDELDEDAQQNLIAYTDAITKRVKTDFEKDPAIAFTRKQYNEQVFDSAVDQTVAKFPELSDFKSEFKEKYFNANNVPANIIQVSEDLAKIFLYEKAQGKKVTEENTEEGRVETERATGGDRNVKASRSLEDWQRMATENPAKFALLSKEYHADLESGKLRE